MSYSAYILEHEYIFWKKKSSLVSTVSYFKNLIIIGSMVRGWQENFIGNNLCPACFMHVQAVHTNDNFKIK